MTNVALAPWFSAHNPLRSPLRWLGDMIKLGLSFIVVMLAFARFDVIWSVVPKLASLVKFPGGLAVCRSCAPVCELCARLFSCAGCGCEPGSCARRDPFLAACAS